MNQNVRDHEPNLAAADPSTSAQSTPSAQSNSVGNRWSFPLNMDIVLQAALLLCCGLALSKGLADPDFWGHVQYGRDVVSNGLPTTAEYTYTAEGVRWINHENVAELAFALGVDTIGPVGLLLFKCCLGMVALGLMLRRCRREGVGEVAAYTGVILIAANMMLFWTLRPQLFSFGFFVIELLLLDAAFAGWNPAAPNLGQLWKWLAPLPMLIAVWTNTHGGFLAGLCILAAFLGLRGAQCLLAAFRGRVRWGVVGRIAAILLGVCSVSIAATLLNPYGLELHQWLLMSLGEPRPEIIEWRPPEFTVPWAPFWALTAASLATAMLTTRKRDWVQWIVFGLTLWQAVEHRRHVVFVSLLFGFWMLPHWDSFLKRCGIGRDESTLGESLNGAGRWVFGGGLAAVMALLATSLVMQVRQIPVRHDCYPVDAFQFIADHRLQGKLLVQLRWGQYAIAAFGDHPAADPALRGQLQVAFDGRFRTCYPQSVVDQYFDFAEGVDSPFRNRSVDSPPADETGVLRGEMQPDLVLIDRAFPNPVRVMLGQNDRWVLVYQDPLCQLFARREQCDHPETKNFIPLASRTVRRLPLTQITPWPALPVVEKSRDRHNDSKATLAAATGQGESQP